VNVYLRLWLTCHLLSAICCCRLYLSQISGMSSTLTQPHRLCLFRVLLDACPFCFLQYTALPACCNCSLFYLELLWGYAPPPLSGGSCHTLDTVGWLLLSEHTGGGGLFIYSSRKGVLLPHSLELRAPCPLCCMSLFLFFQLLVYYSDWFFPFFPWWGSVWLGGYADFSQGCLWEYLVLLICSHVGLPNRL
jgi:hypothetical protein